MYVLYFGTSGWFFVFKTNRERNDKIKELGLIHKVADRLSLEVNTDYYTENVDVFYHGA